MYMDESTSTVVKSDTPIDTVKKIQTLGVKPTSEIISDNKISVRNLDGTKTEAILYIAKA